MLKLHWLRATLQIKGSVIRSVYERVVLCALFGYIISVLFHFGFPVAWPILGFVPNIILGLLLVFRTNTAYERFWEGRRLWGTITISVRNLARQIWIAVDEKEPLDAANKVRALRLLVAFAVATKLHLRQEPLNSELEALMAPEQYVKIKDMNNPPLEVAFWIGDYLQKQHDRGCVDSYQLTSMYKLLDEMVGALSGCERILRTPMPLAYAIHLKQLLLIYCLFLPFDMVSKLNWWTAPVVALVSFMLFGIEEIGVEIENPFGHDPNDLPLDTLCDTMLRNIEDIISLKPSVRYPSVELPATSVD
ncbi:bestrophin family protein [Kamptonema formosum]|uniref:bestrophin family protein n=1 Tax=Kamptonema formosum TaxID=331992 RepID=UPI00034C48CB|nr:bestrophin family ion channel [Oscillatoria sp. PCC 10802]